MMNSKAFGDHIVSISPRIYPMVIRMLRNEDEAADAMQEIMLKLWNKRKALYKHPNMNGYIFLTARNHCLDELKRKNKKRVYIANHEVADRSDIDKSYEQKELSSMVDKAVLNLPENQKEVISLRDLDGLEFNEIAEITGFKKEHIRVLLSRARKHITSQLEEIYNYEKGTA